MTLPASGAASLKLDVQRLSGAEGATNLLVKAIGAGSYVREQVHVELPGQQMFRLAVDRGPEAWAPTGDGVVLYPLPNRVDRFAFQIINETGAERPVTVDLFIPERNRNFVFPRDAQQPDVARELLDQFGARTPLATNVPVALPAANTPQRIMFPAPKEGESGAQVVASPGGSKT